MSAADRFVATDAIRAAVKGHEGDVLDALGVRWREGKAHITCPYPWHKDSHPSWRWDERKARAYCTCIAGSHSIVDVTGQVIGLDFEKAKIRVAELLRRNDLIRTKSEGGNGQKLDAHSLLNAKASRRDDRLPIIYLAHRLRIAEADVPRRPASQERRKTYPSRRIPVRRVWHRGR